MQGIINDDYIFSLYQLHKEAYGKTLALPLDQRKKIIKITRILLSQSFVASFSKEERNAIKNNYEAMGVANEWVDTLREEYETVIYKKIKLLKSAQKQQPTDIPEAKLYSLGVVAGVLNEASVSLESLIPVNRFDSEFSPLFTGLCNGRNLVLSPDRDGLMSLPYLVIRDFLKSDNMWLKLFAIDLSKRLVTLIRILNSSIKKGLNSEYLYNKQVENTEVITLPNLDIEILYSQISYAYDDSILCRRSCSSYLHKRMLSSLIKEPMKKVNIDVVRGMSELATKRSRLLLTASSRKTLEVLEPLTSSTIYCLNNIDKISHTGLIDGFESLLMLIEISNRLQDSLDS